MSLLFVILILVCHPTAGGELCSHEFAQRPENNPALDLVTYDSKRTPSYCDRVVLGTIGKHHIHDDASFKVYQYNAITDEYIDKSDHDLVYGYFSYDEMNILSVTFNLGDFALVDDDQQQTAWNTIICSLKSAIRDHATQDEYEWNDIDIYFFGLQEAEGSFDYNYLSLALSNHMEPLQRQQKWSSVFDMYGSGNKHTASYIIYNTESVFHQKSDSEYIPGEIFPKADAMISEIAFKQRRKIKQLARTKTAEMIGKFRKIKYPHHPTANSLLRHTMRSVSIKYVAFVNAHLPIETGKEDYGVKYRNIAMEDLRDTFKKQYAKKEKDDFKKGDLLVLIGDLNYRIVNGEEQLKTYLNNQKDGFWEELKVNGETERSFLPTCKRETGSWKKWRSEGTLRKKPKKQFLERMNK